MVIGILRTDTVRPEWTPTYGEYPDMFIRLLGRLDSTLEFRIYHVEAGEYPQDIDEVDAYLITGSKSSVYEDQEWIQRLISFVQELHRRHKKTVGICFGHQLIAHALGGETRKSDKGWGMGLHHYRFTAQPAWLGDEGGEFQILASHQDQVVTTAPGTQVLASSEFCENAVCQLGDHMLSFQGHPEFVPEYSREIMAFRRKVIGESVYESGMASLAGQPESERVGRWILNFLRGESAPPLANAS